MYKGKRYSESLGIGSTKAEAKAAEARAFDLARQGKLERKSERIRFMDFARDVWLPWSKDNHSPRWHDQAEYSLKMFEAFFGKMRFAEISSFLIEKFKAERRKTPTQHGHVRNPATINRELNMISSVFTLAIKAGVTDDNPCKRVSRLKEDGHRDRVLSWEEQDKLFPVLQKRHGVVDSHLWPMVQLALNTGLRRTEMLNLKRSEVDLERRRITLAKSKSGRARWVALNAIARQVLMEQLASHSYEYVFVNPKTKKPFMDIQQGWQTACKAAGITDLNWHALRHTFASRLAATGANIVDIRSLLGHSTTAVTDRYLHASDEALQAAVGALDRDCHKIDTGLAEAG